MEMKTWRMEMKKIALALAIAFCYQTAYSDEPENNFFSGLAVGINHFGSAGGGIIKVGKESISLFAGGGAIAGSGSTGYTVGIKYHFRKVGEGLYTAGSYGVIGGKEQFGGSPTFKGPTGMAEIMGGDVGTGGFYYDLALDKSGLGGMIMVGYQF